MSSNINRYISSFSKIDEAHVGTILLPKVELADMQSLFKESKSNPMYECYHLTENEADFFRSITNIHFDFEKFDYFLESEEI